MENEYASIAYVNFLFGIYCATWAKSSGRSAWGWFFFGFFLAPIAGIVLASKHAEDAGAADAAGQEPA
jgi:hypothetical protein